MGKIVPLLLALFAVGTTPAFAEETSPTSYNVELLVFTQEGGSGDLWSHPPAAPDIASAKELSPEDGSDFKLLGGGELRLTKERHRLEQAKGFHPLLHIGWRQPGLPKERAVAVHIHDGANRVDGTARLILSRYLHLELDLAMQKKVTDESGSVRLVPVRLVESRRMRSRELHYFDTPSLGVITIVTPVR